MQRQPEYYDGEEMENYDEEIKPLQVREEPGWSLFLRKNGLVLFITVLAIILVSIFIWWIYTKANAQSIEKLRAEHHTQGGNPEVGIIRSKEWIELAPDIGKTGPCVDQIDDWKPQMYDVVPGTIFVSVASYRDDECHDTVFELFSKANNPDRIYVGVVQQNKKKEEDCFIKCSECAMRLERGQIRRKDYDHCQARGPTFARYIASQLWRGEEWYLMIDSHTKFEKGWDEILLKEIEKTGDPNCVIAHYPPTKEQMDEVKKSGFRKTMMLCDAPFEEDGLPKLKGYVVDTPQDNKPIPTPYAGANMICFPGRCVVDVPFDPHLNYLFFGEELLYSVRLWTSGYNIYAPAIPFSQHHYGRGKKPKYWQDHVLKYDTCRAKAIQRVKYILGLNKDTDVNDEYMFRVENYALGDKRSLGAYWAYAGINIKRKKTKSKCTSQGFGPPPITKY